MDVHNRRIYLRSTVVLVLLLLHGGLILVFLREKPAHRDHQESPEVAMTVFFFDHCFGNMDLGHDMTGTWERYQLGCARKQPARGDLFDSLRKPPEPPE